MAARPEIMGRFTVRRRLKVLGWLATGVMALAGGRDATGAVSRAELTSVTRGA